MKSISYVLLMLLLAGTCPTEASVRLLVRGQSGLHVNRSHLVAGAGSPLSSVVPFEHPIYIDVLSPSGGLEDWHMFVERQDALWPSPSLLVQARRLHPGSVMGGDIVGGAHRYETVTAERRLFFRGSGAARNIQVGYRLNGLSLGIRPGDYRTRIRYTLAAA